MFIVFSDDSEDGEADLHQCGHCREMFTNLTLYITHKIERPCRAGLAGQYPPYEPDSEIAMEDGGREKNGSGGNGKLGKVSSRILLW